VLSAIAILNRRVLDTPIALEEEEEEEVGQF